MRRDHLSVIDTHLECVWCCCLSSTSVLFFIFQHKLANLVTSFQPPAVYVKHVCYSNFSRYSIHMDIHTRVSLSAACMTLCVMMIFQEMHFRIQAFHSFRVGKISFMQLKPFFLLCFLLLPLCNRQLVSIKSKLTRKFASGLFFCPAFLACLGHLKRNPDKKGSCHASFLSCSACDEQDVFLHYNLFFSTVHG